MSQRRDKTMINVTKSYLPPFEHYNAYLREIWERNWLTNNGPLVVDLEKQLKDYLGVKHLFFVANGTLALQVGIKALELKGEIITTPFSYVATTASIVWEGCTPVFVDINADTLCIDPELIEAAITPETVAIVATHVYGNPCNIAAIAQIAEKHNLKIIYDAAHAFGVKLNGETILTSGDISTLSFHATKLFHTVEGGCIVTNDDALAFKIAYMINFGHNGTEAFFGLGINAKNSEFHAAMGLCVLPQVRSLIEKRAQLSLLYDSSLAGADVRRPVIGNQVLYNYAYYPVIFSSTEKMLNVMAALNAQSIFPRRYFFPALNTLNYVTHSENKIASSIASRVLCLPLYHDLEEDAVGLIAGILKSSF
ncbi:MAG: DegT/DnrJ/EryC1/StrS family aminotransferase [Chitinophagaceae bacterium]